MPFPFEELYRSVCAGEAAALAFKADGTAFIRNFRPAERLILLGGGHIAQPLCRYAADLGFSGAVVDDRPSFANQACFPEADQIICNAFPAAIQSIVTFAATTMLLSSQEVIGTTRIVFGQFWQAHSPDTWA